MKREKIEEIIHALRTADCDVIEADFITLIVGRSSSWPGSGDGKTYLLQLGKSGMNADQKRFARHWRGHFAVVTTPFEALDAVGVIDER